MPVSISANSRTTTLRPPPPSAEAAGGAAYALYRRTAAAAAPLFKLWLKRRAREGKEDTARLNERFGISTRARPQGTLIWIHGASVGECVAAVPLIARLLQDNDRHILLTSGTVTSAKLMAERLPKRAFHQYVPIDTPAAVRRFLDHWRPDLALFIESEFWPNLVLETRARKIPMALVNARLSERSYNGWLSLPGLARRLTSSFDIALAQNVAIASRLTGLGARSVVVSGSLKGDVPVLPVNDSALAEFLNATGGRPLFLATSTHPGEEESILQASLLLRVKRHNLLTVIAPRHPERGAEIEQMVIKRNLDPARRSTGVLPARHTDVYIADTLGELGLFYRAASFAFLGGSLVHHGGQNPWEPAKLGTAILAGPHVANFDEIYDMLFGAQGLGRINSAGTLAELAERLLADPALARATGARARAAAEALGGALDATLAAAERLLHNARA